MAKIAGCAISVRCICDVSSVRLSSSRSENLAHGFIAASTLTSPVYRLIWPRDGSKTAVDMLEAGFVPEAKSFFELLETLQKSDGSFAINYYPDGHKAFLDLPFDIPAIEVFDEELPLADITVYKDEFALVGFNNASWDLVALA